MNAVVLTCAHCGAPLSQPRSSPAESLWPCLHCGALLRVHRDSPPTLERTVAADVTAQLRALVLSGKRDEAIRLGERSGVPREAVEALASSVMAGILFSQRLTPASMALGLLWLGVFAGGVALVVSGYAFAWGLVVLGAILPLPLIQPLRTTLRMMGLPSGVATVRRVTHLGSRELRVRVELFAFDVMVTPSSGEPFGGTLLVPVRASSVPKVVVGARMAVRFDPQDRSFIRFERLLG